MALNIENSEVERLAEQVAELTGDSTATAITRALRKRLERLQRERCGTRLADRLDTIARHSASLPIADTRPTDEILGYDENGLPQ